jgi:hypothetical protein
MLPARPWSVLVVLALALAAACEGPRPRPEPVPPSEAARLLINRNWLDHMPKRASDKLHVYRFTPAMGGGVYQDRTLYAGHFELFRFDVDGDRLRFDLPHRREKVKSRFTIRRVDGPEPFDLQLTIHDDPRGKRVYYGVAAEGPDEADLTTWVAKHAGEGAITD